MSILLLNGSMLTHSSQNNIKILYLGHTNLLEKETTISEEIRAQILENLPVLNPHFKENKGQLNNDEIGFYYEQPEFGIAFMAKGLVYRLSTIDHPEVESIDLDHFSSIDKDGRSSVTSDKSILVTLEFIGANHVEPQGKGVLRHPCHYLLGNNPQKWITNIYSFKEVIYPELFDGIDLRFYFTPTGLKYDFIVKPGATPESIKLRYIGIDNLHVDKQDALVAATAVRPLVDQELNIYQDTPTGRQTVKGKFVLYDTTTFGFQILSGYSLTMPLVIDPLIYSTFLGGSSTERSCAITLDSTNNAYITGYTYSSNFPTTTGTYDTSYNGGSFDAFVCKFSADGSTLLYSTFLGGSSGEESYAIALDSANNAYVTGWTISPDFPTTIGANDTSLDGSDVFVSKLSADGSTLLYSTFLGGSSWENGFAIELDSSNNAYVTGLTASSDFLTTVGAYDTSHNGNEDGFVCKLSADGRTLLYSTFFGGNSDDESYDIALDSANNAYVTGNTLSSDFPTTPGANDTSLNSSDAFVCKFNADGRTLLYSTFLGGSSGDSSSAIALDSSNNAYVTGWTESSDFPTTSEAIDTLCNGNEDGFVCKLNTDGSSLLYSTFLGGSSDDSSSAIALDNANNAYVTGYTKSIDFPITPWAYDTLHNGNEDAFVYKLSADGTTLLYSTFLGGSLREESYAITLDSTNNAYMTGWALINWRTESSDFPTTPGVYDTSHNGDYDVFVSVTSFAPNVTITSPINSTYGPPGDVTLTYKIYSYYATNMSVYLNGTTNSTARPNGYIYESLTEGSYNLTILAEDTEGKIGKKTVFFTVDLTAPIITITSPTNSTYISASDVILRYEITDVSLTTMTVYINGIANTSVCHSGSRPSGYSLSAGKSYNLTIVVEDIGGNIGKATVFFTMRASPTDDVATHPALMLLGFGLIAVFKRARGGNRKTHN